ncbi:DUF2971 domain-containing protein [Prosthecobacter vanneervenii]|uniref:DUF2971 domain-containing protein n=1 Tax=Prosthecobacter vanneervenii TaxID=48466 RepID=A0A7W7Y7J7_9BACT|nr:DUF2971 domain-containing protein [Prosthecobacter vanneervenii]MBB5031072.1 hypothetical protein [Prosthecobacter vanneervenii]
MDLSTPVVDIALIEAYSPQEGALLRQTRLPEFCDIAISHYIPAKFFLTLLQTNQIRLGRLDAQKNDPKDGCLPDSNMLPAKGLNEQFYDSFPAKRDALMLDEQQKIIRQLSYIHCWFRGHAESIGMWRDFGSNGTGICIQSSTTLLKNSVSAGWPQDLIFQMHECPYTESSVQLPDFLPSIASVRKDVAFSDQQEVRVLAVIDVTKGAAPLPGPDCRLVPVNLHILLKRIIIGPAVKSQDEHEVREALLAAGIKAEVLKSIVSFQ